MLEVVHLRAGYGRKVVLDDISLSVHQASITTVLGVNGAGKSTAFRTIAGVIPPLGGSILLNGEDITRVPTSGKVRQGLVLVPEGTRSFHDLTVKENLEMGGFVLRKARLVRDRMEEVLSFFPRLSERLKQRAGLLSGGERQMLGIGRAIMLRPRFLLLDEPFLGLAPVMIAEVSERLRQLAIRTNCGVLIAEQNISATLRLSDRAFLLTDRKLRELSRLPNGSFDELSISRAIF
jgi:branched-chain amino acid transport system ATP-binding protein